MYEYDASGNVGYVNDLVNAVSYRFTYDIADRLSKVADSNGNTTSYGYDAMGNVSSFTKLFEGSTYTTNYSYDKDGRMKDVTFNSGSSKVTYDYIEPGTTEELTIRGNIAVLNPVFIKEINYLRMCDI